MKQKAIIVDLDGTLALFKDETGKMLRSPFINTQEDCHLYLEDKVNQPVLLVMKGLQLLYPDLHILLVSGRYEITKDMTMNWLAKNNIWWHKIFMRENGDNRDDTIIKSQAYFKEIEPLFNVILVLDDRDKVVKLWRDIGLTCLQVAPGNF